MNFIAARLTLCMLLQITSTAGGGTLTLEFGILSRLTNNTGKCDIIVHCFDECTDILYCTFST